MVNPLGTAVVRISEFGPFDALSDFAHGQYMDGFSDDAVNTCLAGMLLTTSSGDRTTTQFLRYIQAIALQELGRHHEAVTVALDLLIDVDDDPDPMWRAKALAILAESSTQVGEVSRAMDALAEGAWLVAHTEPGRYSHLRGVHLTGGVQVSRSPGSLGWGSLQAGRLPTGAGRSWRILLGLRVQD
jgi:hypothetical protein